MIKITKRFYYYILAFGIRQGIYLFFLLNTSKRKIVFRLQGYKHPIYLRAGSSDRRVFQQVFMAKQYDIEIADPPELIIDAGANVGLSSIFFAREYPDAHIIAVEPEASNYELLSINASYYPNINPIQAAIWYRNTPLEIPNPGDAFWAFQVREATNSEAGTVRAITIPDLLIDSCDKKILLKLDIEGAEKEIFENGDISWINQIDILIVELHDRIKPGCEAAFDRIIESKAAFCSQKSRESGCDKKLNCYIEIIVSRIIAPIILNCFSRGGSNIFWNLFLSHPEVCSPIDETLQIFGAGIRHATMAGYWVALTSGQRRLFDQWNLEERRLVPRRTREYIDQTLYQRKLRTLTDPEMAYQSEGVKYTEEEVRRSRLALKNNNGLVYLSDLFAEMYPNATFFALARHPFALFDGHKRHKITDRPEEFAHFYLQIVRRMLSDKARLDNYSLVRFEDILGDPGGSIKTLYNQAGLELDAVRKIRLKAKPHLHANGQWTTGYEPGRHYWFEISELEQILEPDINSFQIQNLSDREKDIILEITRPVLQDIGYL